LTLIFFDTIIFLYYMVNDFIDRVVADYNSCLFSLGQVEPPAAKPDKVQAVSLPLLAKKSAEVANRKRAIERSVKDNISKKAHRMMTNLVGSESTLQICIKKELLAKTPSLTGKRNLFFLNMPLELFESAERLKQLYFKRMIPLVTSQSDAEKISLLGEMLLQTIVSHDFGLHLVIAPREIIPRMSKILLHEVLMEGMNTAWTLANLEDTEEANFRPFWELFFKTFSSRKGYNNIDDEWIMGLLRLWKQFPLAYEQEMAFKKNLLNKSFINHLQDFVRSHLETISDYMFLETDDDIVLQETEDALKMALEFFPTEEVNPYKQKLQQALDYLENGNSMEKLSQLIADCYQAVSVSIRDEAHFPIIWSQFVLAVNLLGIDPRRWPIETREGYPAGKNLEPLMQFLPTQFYAHTLDTPPYAGLFSGMSNKNCLLIAPADAVERLDLQTFSQPLVSIQLYGYEKSRPEEWNKIVIAATKIRHNYALLFPEAPFPYMAFYCEGSEFKFHGTQYSKV